MTTLKSSVVIDVEWSRLTFTNLHFVDLKATAKLYFRVPASVLKRYYEEHIHLERGESSDSKARLCLTESALNRLDEHLSAAVVTDSKAGFTCIAYNQNRAHVSFDSSCPALTRSSRIWGYTIHSFHVQTHHDAILGPSFDCQGL